VKNYLNAHSVANTIRMSRSQHAGAFLIVEGDSDVRVFNRFVDSKCRIISAKNKENAVAALDILSKDKFKGVLAVVDADFWHWEGKKIDNPDLLLTDTHDLE